MYPGLTVTCDKKMLSAIAGRPVYSAAWSSKWSYQGPDISQHGVVNLQDSRHPLLGSFRHRPGPQDTGGLTHWPKHSIYHQNELLEEREGGGKALFICS